MLSSADITENRLPGEDHDSAGGLACWILGQGEFDEFASFLLRIFLICKTYRDKNLPILVVFITRRCHVLVEIFWKIFRSPWFRLELEKNKSFAAYKSLFEADCSDLIDEIYQNYLITDNNLLSMSHRLAQYYWENKDLPELLIVDELLIHGRAVNGILMDLERRLEAAYETLIAGSGAENDIKNQMAKRLQLHIYAQNDEILLLLFRYAVDGRLRVFKKYSAAKWRELSLHFARLISASSVNNVAYSWSFCLPQHCDPLAERALSAENFQMFRHVATALRDYQEENFIWLYPNDQAAKVICTFRMKTSLSHYKFDRQQLPQYCLYVPYIIYDHLNYRNVWQLHVRLRADIFKDLHQEALDDFLSGKHLLGQRNTEDEALFRSYYRWLVETNDLLLNCLLVRYFLLDVVKLEEAAYETYIRHIDWQQVGRNFHVFERDKAGTWSLQNIEPVLRSIWEWKPESGRLREYFDLLLRDTPPVWEGIQGSSGHEGTAQGEITEALTVAVQNTIFEIGCEAEKNAYERCISGVIFSDETLADWGRHYSIADVVKKCVRAYSNTGRVTKEEFYELLGILLHAMDLGYIGMNPIYGVASYETDSAQEIYTSVKAGEQSLFIKPYRYRRYISVLSKIEEYYGENWNDVKITIGHFIRNLLKKGLLQDEEQASGLKGELCGFMDELRESGQSAKHWSFWMSEQFEKRNSSVSLWDAMKEDIQAEAENMRAYRGW